MTRTAAATATKVRQGQETQAAKLREAGWIVVAPDDPREVIITTDGRVYCTDDECLAKAAPRGAAIVKRLVDSLRSGLAHLDRHDQEAPRD